MELTPLPNINLKTESAKKNKAKENKMELTTSPNIEDKTEKDSKTSLNKELNLKKEEEKPEIEKNKSFKMDTSFLKND